MAAAHLCDCGHQLSDHQSKSIKKKIHRGACGWDGCDCKLYNFKETKPSNHNNRGTPLNIVEPDIFDPNQKLEPLPKGRKREVYLSDVNHEGILLNQITLKKPKYNNGEYP